TAQPTKEVPGLRRVGVAIVRRNHTMQEQDYPRAAHDGIGETICVGPCPLEGDPAESHVLPDVERRVAAAKTRLAAEDDSRIADAPGGRARPRRPAQENDDREE